MPTESFTYLPIEGVLTVVNKIINDNKPYMSSPYCKKKIAKMNDILETIKKRGAYLMKDKSNKSMRVYKITQEEQNWMRDEIELIF